PVVALVVVGASGCLVAPGAPENGPDPAVDAIEELTPDQGFQVHVAPFAVPAGVEVQDCYFVAVPDINSGADVWIDRFKLAQRPGSHHLNVFRVNTIWDLDGAPGDVVHGGECRVSTNWSDWPLVVND